MMVELSKLNVNINLSGVFFWLPRVLALFLVFSFIAGVLYTFGFGQEFMVGLMVWLILFFTMLIAWKSDPIGGIIFLILGSASVIVAMGKQLTIGYFLAVPLFTLGISFIGNYMYQEKKQNEEEDDF